jgi:hypothetical protein
MLDAVLPSYQLASLPPHQQLATNLVTTALTMFVLKKTTVTDKTEQEKGLNVISAQALAAASLLQLHFSNSKNIHALN